MLYTVGIKFKMNYQSGKMREINQQQSPSRKSWEHANDFHHTQRSKYEKSEVSYANQQKSKVYYEYDGDKTDRFTKSPLQSGKDIQKIIPFKLRSPDHEDKFGYLHVQMYISTEKNSSTFIMHFTDDRDSLFLWSCYVRESEYPQLKAKLSLRVDFHGFPEMLNQMLDCCVDLEKEPRILDRTSYLFAAFEIKKERHQADFRILEATKYKESEHLLLDFKKANDEQLKKYLSHKYDSEKAENQKLNKQISQISDKLNRRIQQVETLSFNLESLEREKNERIDELERSERDKIKREVMKLEEQKLRQQKQDKEKNDRKFQEMSQKIKQLTEKCQKLSQTHSNDHKRIISLEQTEETLTANNNRLQKEVERLLASNNEQKQKQIQMSEEYHNLKNQNTRLTCSIESLQQRMKEKDARLMETSEQKTSNSSQISTLEEHLRQQKKKVEKLEQKNELLEQQLQRTKKKQEDLNQKHQKKKEKIADYINIIKSQERAMEDKQKDMKRVLSEVSQLKMEKEKVDEQLAQREKRIKDLRVNCQNLEEEIERLKKLLSTAHKSINQNRFDPMPKIPAYSPIGSNISRDFSATLTPSSSSRIRYTDPTQPSLSPLAGEKFDRIAPPPIKKYREGGQNDRNRDNSKSPMVQKLNQQLDPEELQRTKEKIGPIKFKR